MTIPSLHIDEPEVTIDSDSGSLEVLARQIVSALVNYPHAMILTGMRVAAGQNHMPDAVTLTQAIARCMGDKSGWARLSFTEIKVTPATDVNGRVATRYSQTHEAIAPHTDLSYRHKPDNLLCMQCVEADIEGGETIIIPIEDVLTRLSKETIQTLREPIYPFADDLLKPIISGKYGEQNISYYGAQLEKGMAGNKTSLNKSVRSALDKVDQLINDPAIGFKLKLKPGDLIFVNNHQALHGRTAFNNDSNRLLYRVRAHVDFSAHNFKGTCQRILNKIRYRKTYFKATKPGCYESVFIDHKGLYAKKKIVGNHALNAFADLMLKQGQFLLSATAYEELIRLDPKNFEASKSLSCLLEERGETEEAELLLKAAVAASPYQFDGALKAGLPIIMRTRGYKDRDHILLRGVNDYSASLSGGHFSLQHLLDVKKVNVIVKNLYDTSLDVPLLAPPFHLLLNTIASPERMEDALKILVEFLEKYPNTPVINHPAKVLMTTRCINYRQLSALDGVVFPKTVSFSFNDHAPKQLLACIKNENFDFPIIVRPTTTHTGEGVVLINSASELSTFEFKDYLSARRTKKYYIIAFHDFADNQGLYNKMRTFCIDGSYYPVANLHHSDWNVHSGDRYSVMDKNTELQDQEESYLNDMASYIGSENIKRLENIRELIGLDFFGIDFTILPDGRLFIFECNAAMRHNFDHVEKFAYTAPALQQVTEAFAKMLAQRLP